MNLRRTIAAMALLGLCHCDSRTSNAAVDPARFWTVDYFAQAAQGQTGFPGYAATDLITLGGNPLPFPSSPTQHPNSAQQSQYSGITVFPAFSEGATASYTVTEIWQNYAQLWVQPLYVFTNSSYIPVPTQVPPVASVGVGSTFYSPYWQLIFVVAPPGTPPDQYRTSSDILNAKLPLVTGPLVLAPLTPPEARVATAQGAAGPVRPYTGELVSGGRQISSWADGQRVSYILFPSSQFTSSANQVVDETPLFFFKGQNGSEPINLQLPAVIGVGALGAHAAARVFTNPSLPVATTLPRFGALSRRYNVTLPTGSGAFVLSSQGDLRTQLTLAGGILTPPVAAAIEARPDANNYILRIAVNASTCFQDAVGFPGSCLWLDSQSRIENLIPGYRIEKTDILLATPVLSYNGPKANL